MKDEIKVICIGDGAEINDVIEETKRMIVVATAVPVRILKNRKHIPSAKEIKALNDLKYIKSKHSYKNEGGFRELEYKNKRKYK